MKAPPTDRHRDIAKRCAAGQSASELATEFQTNVNGVRRAIKRVEDYERGIALLQHDFADIEGLALAGMVPPLARLTLRENGICRLTDLDGVPADRLLRLPHISKRVADQLFGLLEEYRTSAASKSDQAEPSAPPRRAVR